MTRVALPLGPPAYLAVQGDAVVQPVLAVPSRILRAVPGLITDKSGRGGNNERGGKNGSGGEGSVRGEAG